MRFDYFNCFLFALTANKLPENLQPREQSLVPRDTFSV